MIAYLFKEIKKKHPEITHRSHQTIDMKKANGVSRFAFRLMIAGSVLIIGCSKYTVTTGQRDPADSYYKQRTTTTFFWGLVNKPDRVVDTTCGNAGLDEVRITSHPGYSLLNLVTLGIVHVLKVEWKCRKPAPVVGFQP